MRRLVWITLAIVVIILATAAGIASTREHDARWRCAGYDEHPAECK